MEYRDLELTLVSGQDIGPGSCTGRPKSYAKVSLKGIPESAHKSNVDGQGGTNPIWNLTLTLAIPDSSVREPGVEVVVKLYYKRILRDMFVGEVEIPIPVLFDRGIRASAVFNVVPTGSLNISYRFGERFSMPNHPSLRSFPKLRRELSVNLLYPGDIEEKDTDTEDLSSPRGGRRGSAMPVKYTVGSLESASQDLRAKRKDEDAEFSSETSSENAGEREFFDSWNDPTAERKDHFGTSSWKDPKVERHDEGESEFRFGTSSENEGESGIRFGTSSSTDPRVERKDRFGSSSWKDPRAERMHEAANEFRFVTKDGGKIKEKNDEAKSDRYKRFLEDFILFCSVFPLDYEFTKDVLVWQWIARRLIELGEDEEMEVLCTEECVDTLMDMNYIIPSGYDYVLDQTRYKIGDKMTTDRKYLDSKQSHHDPTKVELLSLTFKEIDHAKVGVLKQYSRLHTLVIHDCYEVDHLPSDLFSELKSLKILNLSRTSVVELPSTVENLKELRFLDMSNTPLVWLPESICSLNHLQTLKLDGCLQLEGLPEGTSNLINLRHLILDVVRQLESMPVGIGKLSNLQTLSAFLVGDEEDGCSVRELKEMNKLRGTLRLLNLENVGTEKEASEACLYKKVDLRKVELQWSDVEDEKIPYDEEILESLKPGVGIQELKILFYSGGVLPSWICDPSFKELVTIFLYKCRYSISLPSLGQLPSLKHLSIIENDVVVEIDSSFCRKQRNQYRAAFPKLEKLTFESMSRLERWMVSLDIEDFQSLRHLIIEHCPKLVRLSYLWRLGSLSHLEIRYCPELSLSPYDNLPPRLQSLMIKESPRLKEWCCHENWSKIAHVPTVYFDHHKFPPRDAHSEPEPELPEPSRNLLGSSRFRTETVPNGFELV